MYMAWARQRAQHDAHAGLTEGVITLSLLPLAQAGKVACANSTLATLPAAGKDTVVSILEAWVPSRYD